jgi:putative GTP pyrophosphokinase
MARTIPEISKARATYNKNRRVYDAALRSFSGRVRTLLAKEGLGPIITHRVKEFDSYLTKVARLRKSLARGPILVRDFFGIRVVCPFLDETERVQDLLVKHFQVTEIERKGAGRPLAEFGYESLHVLVRLPRGALPTIPPHIKRLCEVQVRTILQHAWAQIEHELVYKADHSVPKSAIRRKLAAVSATLTLADVVFQETRDNLTDLHDRGVRRRESAQRLGVDDGIEPLAATPREVTRLARRDLTLPDPKSGTCQRL